MPSTFRFSWLFAVRTLSTLEDRGTGDCCCIILTNCKLTILTINNLLLNDRIVTSSLPLQLHQSSTTLLRYDRNPYALFPRGNTAIVRGTMVVFRSCIYLECSFALVFFECLIHRIEKEKVMGRPARFIVSLLLGLFYSKVQLKPYHGVRDGSIVLPVLIYTYRMVMVVFGLTPVRTRNKKPFGTKNRS
jgi:hypothetical protein